MADNEQKALQLIAEAEKKLGSSKGFFGSLFGYVKKKKFVSIYPSETSLDQSTTPIIIISSYIDPKK